MNHPVLQEAAVALHAAVESFKKEAGAVRSSRPSATLFDHLKVNYYEQMTPLKQLANVTVVPPREIIVQVWDKGAVQNVAKAIETSGLGFSPNVDGTSVRIFLPELSSERRAELVKYVKSVAEKHRIQVRHAREEANKAAQKLMDDNQISEDGRFELRENIQKETDKANQEIEKILDAKTAEIME